MALLRGFEAWSAPDPPEATFAGERNDGAPDADAEPDGVPDVEALVDSSREAGSFRSAGVESKGVGLIAAFTGSRGLNCLEKGSSLGRLSGEDIGTSLRKWRALCERCFRSGARSEPRRGRTTRMNRPSGFGSFGLASLAGFCSLSRTICWRFSEMGSTEISLLKRSLTGGPGSGRAFSGGRRQAAVSSGGEMAALSILPAFSSPAILSLVDHGAPRFPRVSRFDAHPSVRDCDERWFEQPINHFGARPPPGGKQTWLQRYFVCRNDMLKLEGAPILFYCGNEANVELYINATGLMWENADALGAGLVFAEHRYFGKSLPFAPDIIEQRLAFLSSEQALADYARLLRHLRAEGCVRRPAVAFGGSYGGMLAAWLRMKYPAAVDGAIAGSAPILSFLGLEPAYNINSFGQTVTFDASEPGGGSATCTHLVRSSWKALFAAGQTASGREQLNRIFALCPSSRLRFEGDVEGLAGWLQSSMDFMAMGSFPYASSYMLNGDGLLPPFPLREMCRRITAAASRASATKHPRGHVHPGGSLEAGNSLLDALREGVGVFYNYSGSPAAKRGCYDLDVTGNNETTADGERWDYLYCSDMLQPAARDGVSDMFYPQPFDLAATAARCRAKWGVQARPEWPTVNYGGWEALRASSNLVFTNGELDPWRGGGVTRNVSDSVLSYVIPGAGHHVDLFFANSADTAPLRAVRAAQVDAVRGWIVSSRAAHAASLAATR